MPTAYWDFERLRTWAAALGERPGATRYLEVSTYGVSRHGRPLLLLTLGDRQAPGAPEDRPALWIDAGTHCAEWAGIMAAVEAVERWLATLIAPDADGEALRSWFARHTVYVAPCLSPDGLQAMHDGAPYLRSTLRPPRPGEARLGFEPRDLDGDGAVRWMRWRHPAGPFVHDPEVPLHLRPRRLDDDPADAYFACEEGEFLSPEFGEPDGPAGPAGPTWTAAPLAFGLDLNRNFASSWTPFSMFGMDGGAYPMSEPEARAVTEAVAARPTLCAALTLHTYTGCVLTQPYRKASPLSEVDVDLMEALAEQGAAGTGWRVIRVYPDFMYDPERPIVGVWADTLATVFGIPGYTVEVWDPYGAAGLTVERPAAFFKKPDPEIVRGLVEHFARDPAAISPWRPFDHPQLGPVEIGGLDELRTVRNPPLDRLPEECDKVFRIAERLRRSLPDIRVETTVTSLGGGLSRVSLVLENHGFLSTTALERGETLVSCPGSSVDFLPGAGLKLVDGASRRALPVLQGWGPRQLGAHGLYPGLDPERSHRAVASWIVRGAGEVTIDFSLARAGAGSRTLRIAP
jgi:hypothetical protein